MTNGRATQKDVARAAGVSQATVSMVLSGGGASIPAETWERITKAAKDLGYVPNRFAQALKTSRTMTIACIVPDITNPFYPSLIRGIQSVADGQNYDVITVNTDGTPERERHFLDWARQGRVDGVVGVFFTLKAKDFNPLVEAGVPIVRIESSKKRGGEIPIDDIYVDSRAAAQTVTEYLLGLGHKRIALVAGRGGPQAHRIEGYRKALTEFGHPDHVVIDDEFSEMGGVRAAESILGGDFRPTAIFAANDLMAIGVMQSLRERGIRIPEDIAVVGFDDISAAKLVTPTLTTVAQFQWKMGERAAQTLMDRLRGEKTGAGTAVEMPFDLIVRGSTNNE
ncbi:MULTISPECIES: LacI family DNA-binding transcriptional regulator [unclassified Rhizobium]|uniref:LacI family DNA-binding transcriptional regulator n=1 Tax=Rhizobium TaxID=379 RepID=UPI00084CB929|nr:MULTISPECIES: LacI family DNA-binding transcriptional regulator [unclassified Rhizobium]OED01181.1 LacI family transcriptional regulator [Rhizobium sp. YK2]QYA15765.1 LacI family DNA-binding transcriptional regulator [Rhizobium sp. AB2/73]UEQ83368.1 LacI family DNA-binding transcriptional regulator [Rhizobium sp. AB2/73]